MAETINPAMLYFLMAVMVLSGAGLGITLKMMDSVEDKNGDAFEHPFFQSLIMFIGESLCIFVYMFQNYKLVKEYGTIQASPGMVQAVQEGMKTDVNPLIFAIPMLCDAVASTLLLIAVINIPASIAQMMGGFVVFVVALMSVLFLKRKQYRHHWTGLGLIFTGIAMVAATALIWSGSSSSKNPVLGVSMMIGSILIQGCQYVVEEKLLGSYYLNPMKVVGWEGLTGVCFFVCLLTILQFIPCDASICSNGVVEDSILALTQISQSAELIIYSILNIFLVAGMNGLGMVVTKYASAANRVTLQQSKTVIVWVFFLVVPRIVTLRVKEDFYFLQLGGFIIMLLGVILYNEILEVPILGFNLYTKAGLSRNKMR
jgi:drug/metabolite transporter (DMT)-like permease